MKTYREILTEVTNNPNSVDGMFRDAGVDVHPSDFVKDSKTALLVYLAYKIQELETRLDTDLRLCYNRYSDYEDRL